MQLVFPGYRTIVGSNLEIERFVFESSYRSSDRYRYSLCLIGYQKKKKKTRPSLSLTSRKVTRSKTVQLCYINTLDFPFSPFFHNLNRNVRKNLTIVPLQMSLNRAESFLSLFRETVETVLGRIPSRPESFNEQDSLNERVKSPIR